MRSSADGTEGDPDSGDLQTVMWTRELAKRLLLPGADVEALEDLLDTYFMQVRAAHDFFAFKRETRRIADPKCRHLRTS